MASPVQFDHTHSLIVPTCCCT